MRQIILLAPLIVIALVALAPMLVLIAIGRVLRHLWLSYRVRMTWPSDKVALLSYTTNVKWSDYLETRVIPLIESRCVVVHRSDAQWKEKNPLAAQLIEFYGDDTSYNPLAIVIRRRGWPKVFYLYEPFQKAHRGDTSALEAITAKLLEAVRYESQRVD